MAERVLNPPTHKPVAGHFLGTVVLEQIRTAAIAMPQRQVIDGQQRLTTLQILLKAAQHALYVGGTKIGCEEQPSFHLAAGQLSQLTANQYASAPDEQYKVWPTNEDRAQFKQVMDCEPSASPGLPECRMAEAYRYFVDVITNWLAGPDPARRALALSSALKDHLRLIVLDLDENDEPQAIFETLNAHGTPLLPADLMKNWLLWEAAKQDLSPAPLYSSYWRQFDTEHAYWRKVIGTGHAARPRVDTFLQNWLTTATRETIPVKHLYDRFLGYANQRAPRRPGGQLDVAAVMSEIRSGAERFREIDAPQSDGPLASTLRRMARLEFVVFRPVLMALLGRTGSDNQDVLVCCKGLESFLVRRMVCGLQTRGYGQIALDLLKAIASVPSGSIAAPAFFHALNGETGSPNEWPSDELFGHNWNTRRFYGWFRRDRVLMILQAIEEHYQQQATKSEPILKFDFSRLTIEHIMPQTWQKNWPLSDGCDLTLRETSIQSIGNLTLVSERLNPSLSNAPWRTEGLLKSKSAGLGAHSNLELNKRLLSAFPDCWDEEAIQKRARDLLRAATVIWSSRLSMTSAAAV